MQRIHFTIADATRVRIVVLGELAELQLSFARLQPGGPQPLFDAWRARTARAARLLSPDVREVARLLAPPASGLLDLFTLVGEGGELAEGIDRLYRTPPGPLRRELSELGEPTGWIGDFTDGDRGARQRLTRALTDYHHVAVGPYWPRIRAVLDRERAARVDLMARHGLDAMLTSLAPKLIWRAPVLEVPESISQHADIHLAGRGLLLAPSVFSRPDPGLFLPWHDGPALLIYPVEVDAPAALRLWHRTGEPGDRALAGLLGATRAAALREIAAGCTTGELARRLGISAGGASQHATVLREAGLVESRRHRNTVRHSITSLGVHLLNAA